MSHEDVDVLRDLVPLVQQRLTTRQVKAPSIKPGRPGETHKHTLYKYHIQVHQSVSIPEMCNTTSVAENPKENVINKAFALSDIKAMSIV